MGFITPRSGDRNPLEALKFFDPLCDVFSCIFFDCGQIRHGKMKRKADLGAGGEHSRSTRSSSRSPPLSAEKTWTQPPKAATPSLKLTRVAASSPAAPAAAEGAGDEDTDQAGGFMFDEEDLVPALKAARKANSARLKARPDAVRLTADRASSVRKSPLLCVT